MKKKSKRTSGSTGQRGRRKVSKTARKRRVSRKQSEGLSDIEQRVEELYRREQAYRLFVVTLENAIKDLYGMLGSSFARPYE